MPNEPIVYYEGEGQGIDLSVAHARAMADGAKYLFVKKPAWGCSIATPISNEVELATIFGVNRGLEGISLFQVDEDSVAKINPSSMRDDMKNMQNLGELPQELRF